jgi:hypothetical protein
MILPLEKSPALAKSPKTLVIISRPKVGKTEAVALLDNTCIIDLQGGTSYTSALRIDIIEEARKAKTTPFNMLVAVLKQIAKERPYKRIAIDTITDLEDIVLPHAKTLYKATPMGVNFEGASVLELAKGAGYLYLRQAFEQVTKLVQSCADEVIYLGHVKDTVLEKDGKEISAKEIDLTGKIKSMLSANVDGIALMYRGENNQNILSFITSDTVICGTRAKHLSNREIVITELQEDGTLLGHWDKVYID